MGYFQVRYDPRVVIYKCKMFIRLATDFDINLHCYMPQIGHVSIKY